ncbi:MAG: repeat-containing protein [Hyphomicrobiales bacterium]|nr:repeat-containing protein [Hyphomicrobiales bacterium]
MKRLSIWSGLFFAAVCGAHAPEAFAQDDAARLGSVHFQTSCNEVAQRRFDRAMRYQHSFWYSAASEIFQEALNADPSCAIAHWGVALAQLNNPHSPVPLSNLPIGLAAIQKARSTGASTQRERDYIEALAAMYEDYDKLDHRTRILRYLAAMEQLAARYPEDDEAQLLYAITLNTSASPNDKTYANQLKGAAIVERVHARQPNHPGVPHYLIHLYDYPAIAEKGLPAALRYAKIAPDAPHAQHMPSHIFTRVGRWKESITSNLASANAARATKEFADQMHGTDYLVYAYLQLAQDADAQAAVADQIATYTASNDVVRVNAGAYALAAGPARYAVERGDWRGAAQLTVRESPLRHTLALTHFARALGAARSGAPDAADADVARLTELQAQLREAKDAYWSEIVDIQRQIAAAWILNARGNREAALAAMSAAADAEDKTEKSPVTPGPLAPARELYGAMLLEAGKPAEALAAFEATLLKEPNRFNAYAGAAQAAERMGDADKAKAYYGKLLEQAADSKSDRPVLAMAARYTGR